uniref:Uncharacterized protein n=1 Tax=Setaria viridis TaxID=4556 RepID=A0A4U6T8E4_SETVI|nr:hypothetical protein SEVIR_9G470250v2 [Setaria viridis]
MNQVKYPSMLPCLHLHLPQSKHVVWLLRLLPIRPFRCQASTCSRLQATKPLPRSGRLRLLHHTMPDWSKAISRMPLDLPAPITRFAAWWMYLSSVIKSLPAAASCCQFPAWLGTAHHESGTWQWTCLSWKCLFGLSLALGPSPLYEYHDKWSIDCLNKKQSDPVHPIEQFAV